MLPHADQGCRDSQCVRPAVTHLRGCQWTHPREARSPAMRKRYLKDLLLNNSSSGFVFCFQKVPVRLQEKLMRRRMFGLCTHATRMNVLHWLANSGQDETLMQLLRHAQNEGIQVNVNLKGRGGLTPLPVAAMYMVIKILVGAFSANIDAMDYSGRRAWQYLKGNAPEEMKELLGTWDDAHGR
ncbi:unnamed protein product, partial [Coregonus sp. 'balchen']